MADVDLSSLWVPVVPDMTQMRDELEKIGYEIRAAVRDAVVLGVSDALVTLAANHARPADV